MRGKLKCDIQWYLEENTNDYNDDDEKRKTKKHHIEKNLRLGVVK